MFFPDQYELIDFGCGRKLERFGQYVLDRPSVAADCPQIRHGERWNQAAARYERGESARGKWISAHELPATWWVNHHGCTLELRRTPFGHVGLFPEQTGNWDWLREVQAASREPLRLLNLFAYTGGATLAAAAAGALVTHVDAARNVVSWARRNATLSGLADAPIRWISEDALTFVRREVRRGNHYQGVILDPPSYGHGPKGQVWKIEQHLPNLLEACADLIAPDPRLVCLTTHTEGLSTGCLRALLAQTKVAPNSRQIETTEMSLITSDGRRLSSGRGARWRG